MKKSKLSKRQKEFLLKTARLHSWNLTYSKALKIFEPYYKNYEFDEELLYQFGMLYDHLGMIYTNLILTKSHIQKNVKKSNECFQKAMKIYKMMLKNNPNSFDAVWGISKIYRSRGNYKKALFYAKKAYRMSKGKAVYGIPSIYRMLGDEKKALNWYKKDLKTKGENDYGAVSNFLFFSNQQYRQKMRKYAETLKKHFDKEPSYLKKTQHGKLLKREINLILNEPKS